MITPIFADMGSASNAQIGLSIVIAFGVAQGIVALMTVASFFATRREVDRLDTRVTKLEDNNTKLLEGINDLGTDIRREIGAVKDSLVKSGDARSSVLHNRINPVSVNLSEMKGLMEGFTHSFNNFTEVMKTLIKRDGNAHAETRPAGKSPEGETEGK